MILTITINPLLERRFTYDKIDFNKNCRGGTEEIKVGGKGINVSRQLNALGTDNFAFTFYGGCNGKLIRDCLTKENIKFSGIRTRNETRECAVLIDKTEKRVYTFFAPDTVVTKHEAEEFMSKMEKMIENCEIAVFSGSSPCEAADGIFPYGIELANKYDKVSVCDTYGRHLKSCIEKKPTVIHNNIKEISESLDITLDNEDEKINFLNRLYEKGIKQVFLTDGGNPAYASNFDFHFKVQNPVVAAVDPTGSGDSFVAGIVHGWHNSLTFEESLSAASCLGAVNASRFEVCNVTAREFKSLKDEVRITPLGKKMKTVDVTPR